ncbi:MAG: RNA polymerase sigma factor [Hormoscilla sp.]
MDRLNGTTDRDFWPLWQEHQDCFWRCCLQRMKGDRTEAEDALHEAMLKAWDAWHQLTEPIVHVKAWFVKLTNNSCTDRLKKRDRQAVGVEDVEVMASSQEWPRQEETPDLFA